MAQARLRMVVSPGVVAKAAGGSSPGRASIAIPCDCDGRSMVLPKASTVGGGMARSTSGASRRGGWCSMFPFPQGLLKGFGPGFGSMSPQVANEDPLPVAG